MLAAWMLTYLVIGALVLVAASAAEHVAVWRGWPRRWCWAAAMVAMLLTPFVPRSFDGMASPFAEAASPATAAVAVGAPTVGPPAVGTVLPSAARLASTEGSPSGLLQTTRSLQATASRVAANVMVVDATSALSTTHTPLLAAWLALSLALAFVVVQATRRLQRARTAWRPADDATRARIAAHVGHAVPVWVAPDTGPAAFGLFQLQVVLPEWVKELSTGERDLLMAHEAAHVRAGDPRLLSAALAALVLLPWHIPLLYAYRRLCRAVEHDCDARVLAQHSDAHLYGRLLVRTAEWLLAGRGTWREGAAARWILAPVPAFAAPASELEQRLRALVAPPRSWRMRLGAGWRVAAATLALMAACVVPAPTPGRLDVAVRAPSALDSIAEYEALARHPLQSDRFRQRMERVKDSLALVAARRVVPDFAQRLTGPDTTHLWLVLDAQYQPVAYRIAKSPYEFAWEVPAGPPSGEQERPATAATPRSSLSVNGWSWARAFPEINPRRYDEEGIMSTTRTGGAMLIYLARLYPGDSTQMDFFRSRGDTVRIPRWVSRVARGLDAPDTQDSTYRRALEYGLRDGISTFRPEFTLPGYTEDPYVWLALGPEGTPVSHGVGRAGLAVASQASGGSRSPLRADANTPDSLLTLDAAAWRAKFPHLAAAPEAFGWTRLNVGGRDVNVLWAFTDLSLARRSSPPSPRP